jgi:uncharacterized protein (TIGR02757 family)
MALVAAKEDRQRPTGLRVLQAVLPAFVAAYPAAHRFDFDPIEFPRRFVEPEDIEVVGLVAACLAYGRASLFKPRIAEILHRIGNEPAQFVRRYAEAPDPTLFRGITYRFNQPEDFAALIAAIGSMATTHGGLGRRFGELLTSHGTLRSALASFGDDLRNAPPVADLLRQRGHRGLRYLVTDARLPGASKRMLLYLRWMVRGPDDVDLGVWRDFVSPSELVIPLDTHIARIARYLRLTNRTDLSWKTAEEITNSLATIDPADPVRFDFYLCHHGMSGACPSSLSLDRCMACALGTCCTRLRKAMDR